MLKFFGSALFAAAVEGLELDSASSTTVDKPVRHSCFTSANQKKKVLPNWDEYKNSDSRFEDLSFAHNKNSIYWDDMDETIPIGLKGEKVNWVKAADAFEGTERSLWG